MTLARCLADAEDLLYGAAPPPTIPSTLIQPPHPISMRPQEKTWWCWAAVAQAVGLAHGAQFSQAEIAHLVRPQHCPPPLPPAPDLCDQPADLQAVLAHPDIKSPVGRFDYCSRVSLRELRFELGRHAVPCSFKEGSAVHYCLIVGMRIIENANETYVQVLDPWCATLDDYLIRGQRTCHVHPMLSMDLDYVFFLT